MYNFELLIIYLTSIVILTAVETYKYKVLYLPVIKSKIFLYNTLLYVIIIIPIVTESMFTSTIYIYTNNIWLIIICNIIIMSIFLRQYIIIDRYKSYIVYITMVCIHRILVIYILKNNYIHSFILSSCTIILTLITHIYVYRTYVKHISGLPYIKNRPPHNHLIRIRKRSASFSGEYMSKSRILNNMTYKAYYEDYHMADINLYDIPDDIQKLYDKFNEINDKRHNEFFGVQYK